MSGTSTGRFRRSGVVRATQLTSPRRWTTDGGDVLQAQAGDWWVVGADGGERSVAPDAFAATYEHIDGDNYRRTGTVTARRVSVREVVATLEGDVVADPGMWVVTDDAGRSWPVPDVEFRRGYQPQ